MAESCRSCESWAVKPRVIEKQKRKRKATKNLKNRPNLTQDEAARAGIAKRKKRAEENKGLKHVWPSVD